MIKNLPTHELKPGMFVTSVIKQSGNLKIKKQGWVKTRASIKTLVEGGVSEVQVDLSKTLPQQPQVIPDEVVEETIEPTERRVSFEQEIFKAKALYNEAKILQRKAFADIRVGKDIDVEETQELARRFIKSIFDNQDALVCMTRIREKDSYLLEHSINVSILITVLAKHLKLDKEVIHELATGALLHDLGKVKIPDSILNKPGKLTNEEFALIKTHPKWSKEILENAGVTGIAIDVASHHHERLDGKGYPFGIRGDQLSIYARMISVVDVYDALTAERVYKKGMTPIKAFKIMLSDCPDKLDERLVKSFINSIGLHPVGSLVKLQSEKLGLVTQTNFNNPLRPAVKAFYNLKHKHYTQLQTIDLSDSKTEEEIDSCVKPDEYNIDLKRFFKHAYPDN